MKTYATHICNGAGPMVDPASACPNVATHTPHPVSYIGHSEWAEVSMLVAGQEQCPGCGLWAIWKPKWPDLRVLAVWLPPACGWVERCRGELVAERQVSGLDRWLAVCADHAEVRR